jgi:hypothetical protein
MSIRSTMIYPNLKNLRQNLIPQISSEFLDTVNENIEKINITKSKAKKDLLSINNRH